MQSTEKSADHLLITVEITNRCNYKCPYCYNQGDPNNYDFFSVHDGSEWLNAFRSKFEGRDLELYFTGGEVFVYKDFLEFLPKISNEPNVKWIQIDTNGSLTSKYLSILDPQKVSLMMTFHPTQVSLDKFIEEAQKLQEHGVLKMVNYVAYPFEIETLNKYLEKFTKLGIFLNVTWNINAIPEYDDFAWKVICNLTTPEDTNYILRNSVYGKSCLAGVCYANIDMYGNLYRCHGISKIGNIFDNKIELLKEAKPCKTIYCDCSVRYSLLTENRFPSSHFLIGYVNRNREYRRQSGLEYGLTIDKPYKLYHPPAIPVGVRMQSKASRMLRRLKRKSSSLINKIR